MAQLLNGWRYRVLMLVTIVVPLAVRAFLTLPEYADQARPSTRCWRPSPRTRCGRSCERRWRWR